MISSALPRTVILAPAGYTVDPELGSDYGPPWHLAKGLAERGLEVVLVARMVGQQAGLGAGVQVVMPPGAVPRSALGRMLDRVYLLWYCRHVVRRWEKRTSLLAVHHYGPCSPTSPSLLGRGRAPVLYGPTPGLIPRTRPTDQSEYPSWIGLNSASGADLMRARLFQRRVGGVARWLWRRTMRRVDAVTVEAAAYRPAQRPDAVVIPVGIDVEKFSPAGEFKRGRIVAVGKMVRRKGFDVLIEALPEVLASVPGAELVFAGDGAERKSLESRVQSLGLGDRVHFLGIMGSAQLLDLYRSAAVVCHPARLDNYPRSVVEALACGVPVIASDVGALPEIVGSAGLATPVEDVGALSRALIHALTKDEWGTSRRQAARELAVLRFSVAAMCDSYLELYRNLYARKTAPTQAASAPSP